MHVFSLVEHCQITLVTALALGSRPVTRLSHDRWLEVGSALTGLGGAGAISYYIYAREQAQPFWRWQGILAVSILALGLGFLIVGFLRPGDAPRPWQIQGGGKKSTNQQAGRDIRINEKDS